MPGGLSRPAKHYPLHRPRQEWEGAEARLRAAMERLRPRDSRKGAGVAPKRGHPQRAGRVCLESFAKLQQELVYTMR